MRNWQGPYLSPTNPQKRSPKDWGHSEGRRQVPGPLVLRSVLCQGSSNDAHQLTTVYFPHSLHKTPFKDSREIRFLESLSWLSTFLRVEPNVLSDASRAAQSGPHYLSSWLSSPGPHRLYLSHTGRLGLLEAFRGWDTPESLCLLLSLEYSLLNIYVISFTSLGSLLNCHLSERPSLTTLSPQSHHTPPSLSYLPTLLYFIAPKMLCLFVYHKIPPLPWKLSWSQGTSLVHCWILSTLNNIWNIVGTQDYLWMNEYEIAICRAPAAG